MAQEGIFDQPVSSMLARALAAAAAGYPGDGEVYLVASYQAVSEDIATFNGTFDIQPAFTTYDEAASWITCSAVQGYGVFGPFESTFYQQLNPGQALVDSIVALTDTGEEISIPEAASSPPNGPTGSPPSPPMVYDALFLSASAVAKFAVPYYSNLYSADFAQRVLTTFQQSPVALMGHYPWSEYTDLPDAPTLDDSCRTLAHVPVVFARDPDGTWRREPIIPHPSERKNG